MRDLAVQRGVHRVHDVLERQVGQRGATPTVRGERRAEDLQVDGPLGYHVAHDAHARRLRVRSRLLEVIRAQRGEMVRARPGAFPEHQVRVDKVDVEARRDDVPVDQVVQLRPRQLHRRPSGRVGEVRCRRGGPYRRGGGHWHRLHWDEGGVERMTAGAGVIWMEQRRLVDWRCDGRSRWHDGKKCR